METVENRKRFTHRSHSLRSPSFSSLAFSLYREKCPFSIPKTYSCRDEPRAACQYGKEKQTAHRRFYPQKKPRNMTKKKPSITLMAWCWAYSDCSDFQRVKQCSACKQLFRILLLGVKMYCSAILRTEAYRVHSIVLCFLIYFFCARRKKFTVFTTLDFSTAFLLPHSQFTQQLSQNAAAHL